MNVEYDDRGRGTKAYTKRVGAERRIQIHCVAFTQDRLMMSKALEGGAARNRRAPDQLGLPVITPRQNLLPSW